LLISRRLQIAKVSAAGGGSRSYELGTERDDAGRVEGHESIIAALDRVQIEGVAEGRNRDPAGETGAHILVIGHGAGGGEGRAG
jgi:hypothetical protein